ncbi:family 20 glycosylhydrolase [Carnobacteriaceae bacterium zg-ZUI252]|nr:family 20 glycosylhydrolase [Carnobacteriaceae bacterium zg-ZUI252]MBS4770190.1 family 20 glycosylhydrolase [Carnobacteriaceae bacterium zg-ZUI240]
MSKIRKVFFVIVTCLAMVGATVLPRTVINAQGDTTTQEDAGYMKVYSVDAGRKYFSVDQIKQIIDKIATLGFSHLQLLFGNDGLRLVLDDLSVSAGGEEYSHERVKTAIENGNRRYYDDPNGNALTQAQMEEILAHAQSRGIKVIPGLNSPGHMDTILNAMEELGITNTRVVNGSKTSKTTVELENTKAVEFTRALISRYVTFFNGKAEFFNLGADEYANDTGSGFAYLQSRRTKDYQKYKYTLFIDYINSIAQVIKSNGMKPVAFNDGIYYKSTDRFGTFDSDIIVAYWIAGWNGYDVAKPFYLNRKGHKLLNTNDGWYYVVGLDEYTDSTHNNPYTGPKAHERLPRIQFTGLPGGRGEPVLGAVVCMWADYPSNTYDASVPFAFLDKYAQQHNQYFNRRYITEYVTTNGVEIEPSTINDEKQSAKTFDDYEFVSSEDTEFGIKYKYAKKLTTKYVDVNDEELEVVKQRDFATNKEFPGYTFVETRLGEEVTTHVYYKNKTTKFVDEQNTDVDTQVVGREFAVQKDIDGYTFVETTVADDVTTHVYYKNKTTKFVDEQNADVDTQVVGREFATQKDIDGYTFVETTVADDVTTHVYYKNKTTKFVDAQNADIDTQVVGREFADKKVIDGYTFVETTVANDVTTHRYEAITDKVLSNTPTDVSVMGTSVSLKDATALVVEPKTLANVTNEYNAYDITLVNEKGDVVQPSAPVRVVLPATKEVDGVFYINGDNKEAIPFTREGNTVVFEVEHFSVYAVVYKAEASTTMPTPPTEKPTPPTDEMANTTTQPTNNMTNMPTPPTSEMVNTSKQPTNNMTNMSTSSTDNMTNMQTQSNGQKDTSKMMLLPETGTAANDYMFIGAAFVILSGIVWQVRAKKDEVK